MATQLKSLGDFHVPPEQIRQSFQSIVNGNPLFSDLYIILEIGLRNMPLFPNIRLAECAAYTDYLFKWVKGYEDAAVNPPSLRTASPKGSCSDPAIQAIVQMATGVDHEFIQQITSYHNLFMSAENIQGNLLEEYISLSVRPYGWIWCKGTVLHAVDFCSSDGAVLLQVKNKSNTENSSSSAVRAGTAIIKWYRLGTQTKNGQKLPDYKWDKLNEIINSHVTTNIEANCSMNEASYQAFLYKITSQNTNIISDK